MEQTPRILTGPPGCGKSHWIQKYAESVNKQLFVCPCRKDRTLREGRQKLHIWARRTEPAILWLEGADDLTPEAQAFLRRILETHAKEVQFILECRDAGRLQEPIRSRCIIQRILLPSWAELDSYARRAFPFLEEKEHEGRLEEIRFYLTENEYSYRRIQQCAHFIQHDPQEWQRIVEHRQRELQEGDKMTSDRLMEYVREAYHPERMIRLLLKDRKTWRAYGECVEEGGSLWAFLGSALDKRTITPAKQEE
jgi:ATPase family associated with various cellular activities (AAA)